jgi:gluconate 5-dehydrogenase
VGDATPAAEMDDATWRRVLSTNLDAVFYVAREVGKVMIEQGYGKIINLGSLHSEVVMPGIAWPVTAYTAAKGGVKMLTKSLAVEWAQKGITVNAIGPAYFNSEMTGAVMESGGFDPIAQTYCPMGRAGREGELNGAVIYFASDASSYTTGQLLCIDGGWTAI